MAVTKDVQHIITDKYYSLNTLFGVAAGTEITVHNLSFNVMKLSISATQPLVDDDNWLLLYPTQPAIITAGEAEVWVYGAGDINIQEA